MRYNINFSSINRVKRKQAFAVNIFYVFSIFFLLTFFILAIRKVGNLSVEIERVKNEKRAIEEMIQKGIEERRKLVSDEEIRQLNEKMTFYKDIYEKRFFVTVFLTDIEDTIVGGMSLKSLDMDIPRKNFVLTGESLNPESAVAFSKKLQGISYIKKAEITRQTFQRVGEKKVLINDFEIKGEIY